MDNVANHPPANVRRRSSLTLVPAVISLVLGIIVAVSCYLASAVSLGLFFGPMLLVAFIVPPLVMGEESTIGRLSVVGMLALGVWLVWLVTANLSIFDAVRCGLVLVSYILALAGASALLEAMRLGKTFSAAAAVFGGTAWLTWPIWLCPWLRGGFAQTLVNWLTVAHPLMAMNSILFARFNFWDRYNLAYQQLTTLNQDILYTLPRTIAWMAVWHILFGAAGMSVNHLARRR